jgi:outer membrane protein assembly factor BamB
VAARGADDLAGPLAPLDPLLTAGAAMPDGWEKDLPAALKSARAALAGKGGDERGNHIRLVRVLEATVAAGAVAGDQAALTLELADELDALGWHDRSRRHLARLVELSTGNAELAARCLQRIAQPPAAAAWLDYAAQRLAALDEAALLPRAGAQRVAARNAELALAVRRREFWRANLIIDSLPSQQRLAARLSLAHAAGDTEWLLSLAAAADPMPAVSDQVRDTLRRAESDPPHRRAVLARSLSAEARLQQFLARGAGDAEIVSSLLDELANGDSAVQTGPRLYTSIWRMLDDSVLASPQATAAMRQAQQAAWVDGGPAAMRRWPFAPQTHAMLLRTAEAELRAGWPGVALRDFQDVLRHSADAAVRAQAQAGVWMATAATTDDPAAIAAAFAGVKADELYPWMGRPTPASAIKAQLAAAAGAPPAAPAAGVRAVAPPPAAAWSASALRYTRDAGDRLPPLYGELSAADSALVVAGPSLLACYSAADPARALWIRQPQAVSRNQPQREGQLRPLPGPYQPFIAQRRIVSRWSTDAGEPPAVAMFDARSGAIVWNCAVALRSQGLIAAGDPVESDGRVYFMATQAPAVSTPMVHLVCVRADDGTMLFARPLASAARAMTAGRDSLDVTLYGNAVAVDRGAVYCSPATGVVARLDARDGQLEWAVTYQRMRSARLEELVGRRGATPIVAGELAIFMPRDGLGIVAVNRQTGQVAWESTLLRPDEALGLHAGMLAVRLDSTLLAVDVTTGSVAWRRDLTGQITGRPAMWGPSLYVPLGGAVMELDAATGLQRRRIECRGASTGDLAATAGGVFLLSGELAAASASPAVSSTAPAAARELTLPLAHSWMLPAPVVQGFADDDDDDRPSRRWLRALPQPSTPGLADRVYVMAGGIIHCLPTRGQGPIWQRHAPAGLRETGWVGGRLVLASNRSVVAVDGATGRTAWQTALPFEPAAMKLLDARLVACDDFREERSALLMDLSTGRIVWQRSFGDLPLGSARDREPAIGLDGDSVYIISGCTQASGAAGGEVLALRSSDGVLLEAKPVGMAKGANWPRMMQVFGGWCIFATNSEVNEFSLDGKPLHGVNRLGGTAYFEGALVGEPYLLLRWRGRENEPSRWCVLKRGDATFRLDGVGNAQLEAGGLVVLGDGAAKIIDLATRRETNCVLPPGRGKALAAAVQGDRVAVVYGENRDWANSLLHVCLFDKDGKPLGTQPLVGCGQRDTTLLAANGTLMVSDLNGLHVFAPGTPRLDAAPVPLIARKVLVDGDPSDWMGASASTAGVQGGRIQFATDDKMLYIGIVTPGVQPTLESGGDMPRMELAIRSHFDSFRYVLWEEGGGVLRFEPIDGTSVNRTKKGRGPPVNDMLDVHVDGRAFMMRDSSAGITSYELAIPLDALIWRWDNWRRMGLSVVVWGNSGPGEAWGRMASWGGGLAGEHALASAHGRLAMQSLTDEAAEALSKLALAAPGTPHAIRYWRDYLVPSAPVPQYAVDAVGRQVAAKPSAVAAESLLDVAAALADWTGEDYLAAVRKAAADAGAPADTLKRYDRLAGSYISQMVYITGDVRGLELAAISPDGGWHNCYWGKRPGSYGDGGGPRRAGDVPARGKWAELRMPLYRAEAHRWPIAQVAWGVQGAATYFGECKLMIDGQATTLVAPSASPAGGVDVEYKKDIAGSACLLAIAQDGRGVNRGRVKLAAPVDAHLAAPAAVLSQWVLIDAKQPPAAIRVALAAGGRWAWSAGAGEAADATDMVASMDAAVAMPAGGQWRELRLPLGGDIAARPIEGVAFCSSGPGVIWGPTALIGPGSQAILPVSPAESPACPASLAPWRDDRGGGLRGAIHDGRRGLCFSGDARIGSSAAPALQSGRFSLAAFVWLDELPDGWPHHPAPDRREWIVAAAGGEWDAGHYGLFVDRSQQRCGLYLNAAGGSENVQSVTSAAGSLRAGRWHHAAAVVDQGQAWLYLDGNLVGAARGIKIRPPQKNSPPRAGSLTIGGRGNGWTLHGAVDGVRVFDSALSPAEVAALAGAKAASQPQPAAALKAVVAVDADQWVLPADAAGAWQWLDDPHQPGRKVHATAGAADGIWSGHCVGIAPAAVAHLAAKPADEMELMRKSLPLLPAGPERRRLFERMLELTAADADPAKSRRELCRWFLAQCPQDPYCQDVLAMLLRLCSQNAAPPVELVEGYIRDLPIPPAILYRYNRSEAYGGRFDVTGWQICGPFAAPDAESAHQTALGPEPLAASAGGEISWQPAGGGSIPLHTRLQAPEGGAAYARTVIRSQTARPVSLEINCTGQVKAWLNGTLVYSRPAAAGAAAATDRSPVAATLKAGDNDLLVKITRKDNQAHLLVELLDPQGKAAPPGVTFGTTTAER